MKTLLVATALVALAGCSGGELSAKDAETAKDNFSRKPTAEETAKAERSRLPVPP